MAGEVLAVDEDGRPVPPDFWGAPWVLDRAARSLQAMPAGPVYLNPRLVPVTPRSAVAAPADKPGPKAGFSGKARVAELVDTILNDEKIRPALAHGWKTKLARMTQHRLSDEGHKYELESVKRTLRELKIKHPDESG
jgi:hypothetical protein